MVAGRLAQRQVAVTVTEAPIIIQGDRRRLVEVFENLLDNAAKFMGDQAEPRIEVGVDESGAQPIFFVRDNGVGIDPRHASKLFGLFEKLHPESEGTGIGLALVKRIVEVHGGRIWMESPGPGQGSTFRFTLARSRRQAAPHPEAS
ncbi:MAG: ATP-binding protein [Acidobacteriota bacterium]